MSAVVLEGKLTLDDSQFNATAKKSEKTAASAGTAIGRGFKSGLQGFSRDISQFLVSPIALAGSAIAGALSARAFASGIKSAIEMGSNMQKISQSTNMAVGSQSMLNSMFKIGGEEAKDFNAEIENMERLIVNASQRGGHSGANSIFSKLKIDIKELKQLSPDEQFRKIGQAINAIADPVDKITTSIRIFGEGGQKLIPVFDSLGKGNDLAAAKERADLYKRNAEAFRNAEIAIERFKLASTGLFVGVAEKIAPLITNIANSWSGYDWLAVGKKIGDGIGSGITATSAVIGADWASIFEKNILDSLNTDRLYIQSKLKSIMAGGIDLFGKTLDDPGRKAASANWSNDVAQSGLNDLSKAQSLQNRLGKETGGMGGTSAGGSTSPYIPTSPAPIPYSPTRPSGSNLLGGVPFGSYGTPFGPSNLDSARRDPSANGIIAPNFAGNFHGFGVGKPGQTGTSPFSFTGGLSGGVGQRTVGSYLSLSERRAHENDLVASGTTRKGTTEGAHNAVRSGDKQRRKDYQAAQERGLNVQEQIARNTGVVADAYKGG